MSQWLIGHFGNDLLSQSLDWCNNLVFPTTYLASTSKPDLTATHITTQN